MQDRHFHSHRETWRQTARDARLAARLYLLGASLAAVLAGCTTRDPGDFQGLAADLLAHGGLRTERAPADAPYSAEELIRSFRAIAFAYEFHFSDGRIVHEQVAKPLSRWQGTIRYRLMGDAVTPADLADIETLTAELADLTGLRFERTDGEHEMLISIATPAGREAVSAHLARTRGLGAFRDRYDAWRSDPDWLCGATVVGSSRKPDVLRFAHVFIGAELTGILRRSCLHEEIAQSLGLTNDSDARPSIFNDDHEFVLLTEHDAILMRTLYDPRLRPGMSADEAMPIAAGIIRELVSRPAPARSAVGSRAGQPAQRDGIALNFD